MIPVGRRTASRTMRRGVWSSGNRADGRSASMFAAIMLMIAGSFQIIAGLAGIFENEFYAATPNYFLKFDASVWGWIPCSGACSC